jgi:DNA modification methylase
MQIVTRKIDELIPYINNARTHSDEQIAQIAASIKEFGFTNPLLIDGDNGLIAGHGRLLAARKLNIEELPTIELSHLSEAQRKAYILADNKLAQNAGWDDELLKLELSELDELGFDLSITGFSNDEIRALTIDGNIVGLTDEDDVPEVPDEPITKRGDVWLCGEHRVMCGDSTLIDDVEKLMDGQKADMVFTDPPYGVSYASKNAFLNARDKGNRIQSEIINDHMDLSETSDFIYQAFLNIKLCLAERSSYYITSPQGGDLLMMMMMMMIKAGLPLRHCLIWVKNNHVLGRTDYNYKHEPILYGWDSVHDFYGAGDHKFSTWEINKPHKNDLHPTMKPVELMENACLNSTKKDQVVLDLFGGSGSTLIACEKTNRHCMMMELDPKYCDVIIKRWQDFTGKQAFLESTGKSFG